MDDIWPDTLEAWSKQKLSHFCSFYGISADAVDCEEELRCIAYSYASSSRNEMTKCELSAIFPDSAELIDVLLESTDYNVTTSFAQELIEQFQLDEDILLIQVSSKGQNDIPATVVKASSPLIAVNDADEESSADIIQVHRIDVSNITGVSAITKLPFGLHRWTITFTTAGSSTGSGSGLESLSNTICKRLTGVISCRSPTYDYINALEDAFDELHWGWAYGGSWTDDMENSLLEMLVAVSDDLSATVRNWAPMMAMIGGAAQEMNKMLDTVSADVGLALRDHAGYAIGRLHQSLVQLVDLNALYQRNANNNSNNNGNNFTNSNSSGFNGAGFSIGSMMGIPEVFSRAVEVFVKAKLAASPVQPLLDSLIKLVDTIPGYVKDVLLPRGDTQEANKLQNFADNFHKYNTTETKDITLSQSVTAASGADQVPSVAGQQGNNNNTNSGIPWELLVQLHALQPKAMDMFSMSFSGMLQSPISSSAIANRFPVLSYLPVLPLEAFPSATPTTNVSSPPASASLAASATPHTHTEINDIVQQYSESLAFGAVNIGSMLGYYLGSTTSGSTLTVASTTSSTVIDASQKLLELLDAGFTYVANAGKLMAILPTKRSVLVLRDIPDIPENMLSSRNNPGEIVSTSTYRNVYGLLSPGTLPPGLIKRLKDMPRIFRNKIDVDVVSSSSGNKDGNSGNIGNNCCNQSAVPSSSSGTCDVVPVPPSTSTPRPAPAPAPALEAEAVPMVVPVKHRRTVSFRLNTDFDLAISMLRQHHGEDCWVGSELEAVWRHMFHAQPPTLLIFELWYHSADGESKLVAADFAHPTANNASLYVATRFFNRESTEIKQLQPGFLLALVETQFLRDQGCVLWDLGGVDKCPLMQYKYDLTGEAMSRPIALSWFQRAKEWGACRNRQHKDDGEAVYDNSSNSSSYGGATSGDSISSGLGSLRSGTIILPEIALTDLFHNTTHSS